MQLSLWNVESIDKLKQGDEGAWMVFTHQAVAIARGILRGTVEQTELDDECMVVVNKILSGLNNWDPTKGFSIESYVSRKALDRRIRYSDNRKRHPNPMSLDELHENGFDQPSPDCDAYTSVERDERSSAILAAMIRLDPQEYMFLRLREDGHSLSQAASAAGYPTSDLPANVIRRIKRKFARLLLEQPFFRDNPEELSLIRASLTDERNDDARLHR